MRENHSITRILLWGAMGIVILAVITVGIFTNLTLRSVEKNLPGTLLVELGALTHILDDLAEVVSAAELAAHTSTPEKISRLRNNVEFVFQGIAVFRNSFVFDNLVQASAFHAVVAPALADLQIWLSEGVSGYGPESKVTAGIVLSRIREAYREAQILSYESQRNAQQKLKTEREQLDQFLFSVNLLIGVTVGLILIAVFLLIRQYSLQRTKDEAQARRALVEASLRDSEKKYRTILESIEDGYYEVDLEGTFVFINEAMHRVMGYSLEEILGNSYRDYMDDVSLKKVFRTFNQVYRTGAAAKATNWELVRKDGRRCFIETSVSLITDAEGQPTGFRGLCRDVSDKRNLEAQLQRSQKMEALGLLAGGVAHDLNNVLSGIVSYPELLLMDLPEDSPLKNPLLTIQQSGKRASEIVQDLLTLARRGVTQTEVLNLNEILDEYLHSPEHAKLVSYHRNVTIEEQLDEDLLNTQGSAIHLKKTIMNLVSNAAEAQPRGGLISIATENRHIDRPLKGYQDVRSGDYAVLIVQDEGEGISPDDMKHLFEPFYTKKIMGRSGTGLGMAVVWGTVQDHQGYININSSPGKGTLFELYFPSTRAEIRQLATEIPVEKFTGSGELILVVDDIREQRDIASGILKRLGYKVVTASGGEDAVAFLHEHLVDLVILDMIMDPGIDGLDTYRKILDLRPGQKAIVSSGFSETRRVREMQRLGARQYIKKPYTIEKMGLAVKKAFSDG